MKHHEARISKCANCVVSDTKIGSEVLVVGLRWNWRLSLMSGALAAEKLNVERPLAKPLILYPKIGIIGVPNAGKSLGDSGVSQHWTFQKNDEKAFQRRQHQASYVVTWMCSIRCLTGKVQASHGQHRRFSLQTTRSLLNAVTHHKPKIAACAYDLKCRRAANVGALRLINHQIISEGTLESPWHILSWALFCRYPFTTTKPNLGTELRVRPGVEESQWISAIQENDKPSEQTANFENAGVWRRIRLIYVACTAVLDPTL